MSDERRPLLDDSQLAAMLRSYAETGLRSFDPASIAAGAIGDGRRAKPRWWLPLAPSHGREVRLLVALGLLLLGVALTALIGTLNRRDEQTIIAGSIAVWGFAGGTGEAVDQIRIVKPDGSGEMAFPSTGHDSYPVWSPDGTRIAYTAHDGRGPVRVISADGTSARSITDGYASPRPVTWSPDGRQVAFVGYRYPGGTDRGLYVVNVDGTGLVRLIAAEERELMRLAWSPDGSLIAFVAVGGGTPDALEPAFVSVHVVDPRTGSVAPVSDSRLVWEGDHAAPSWSPDSRQLLYAVARTRDGPGGIAVAGRSPAGWTERMVAAEPIDGTEVSPQWLDAARFVFVRSATRLFVANADGTGQRELAQPGGFARTAPCVAPDGSRVAVPLAQPEGATRGELLIVAVDEAIPPLRIPTGDIWAEGPGCSWQALQQ